MIAADLDGDLLADDIAVAHFAFGVTVNFNGLPSAARTPDPAALPGAEGPGSSVGEEAWKMLDVDRDGFVLPLDALLIVNDLNGQRAAVPNGATSADAYQLDVTGDGYVSPLDALWVLNYLNADLSMPASSSIGSPHSLPVFSRLGDRPAVQFRHSTPAAHFPNVPAMRFRC